MSIEFVQTWRPPSLQISMDMLYLLTLTSEKEITVTGSLSVSSHSSSWVFRRMEKYRMEYVAMIQWLKWVFAMDFCTPMIVFIIKVFFHLFRSPLASKSNLRQANRNWKKFCNQKKDSFTQKQCFDKNTWTQSWKKLVLSWIITFGECVWRRNDLCWLVWWMF